MSTAGRKPPKPKPKYPFNSIKAHKTVQKRIDSELNRSIKAPSEQTSIYVKGPGNVLEKVPK
jgi:hypothetical protein